VNISPPGSPLCAYATLELAVVNPTRHDLRISLFTIDASPAEPITGLLLRNVTEQRYLQRRRDTFVSVASHELRTPMTTAMGFTELLMSSDADEEHQVQWLDWLDHIYKGSRRVITIVDELLNVSRIQSGNVSVKLLSMDIKPLLVRASASTSSRGSSSSCTARSG
jgi:signal transduction histidine kinase